jgi:hypothetical protein
MPTLLRRDYSRIHSDEVIDWRAAPILMHRTKQLLVRLILLILLLLCSASMCIYWNRVPDALHDAHVRTGLPQAKPLTDLYPRWYGTRELLLHHRDPYGAAVSREIQLAY